MEYVLDLFPVYIRFRQAPDQDTSWTASLHNEYTETCLIDLLHLNVPQLYLFLISYGSANLSLGTSTNLLLVYPILLALKKLSNYVS